MKTKEATPFSQTHFNKLPDQSLIGQTHKHTRAHMLKHVTAINETQLSGLSVSMANLLTML